MKNFKKKLVIDIDTEEGSESIEPSLKDKITYQTESMMIVDPNDSTSDIEPESFSPSGVDIDREIQVYMEGENQDQDLSYIWYYKC
jgi:hypothetical protein